MGIKNFVREHCPEFLLPALRTSYRIMKMPSKFYLCAKISKFEPYYQDELSRKILADHKKYIASLKIYAIINNIFISRAVKEGWTYTRLIKWGFIIRHHSVEKYSGYVILEHDDREAAEYTRNLLKIYCSDNEFRIMNLKNFLKGEKIDSSELVIAAVKPKNYALIEDYARRSKLSCNIACSIIGMHDEIQYLDVFKPVNDEIVVEAGALDGMTALRFLEWGGEKIKHIYSFELDPANFEKCERNLKAHTDKVTLVKKGTWDKETTFISSSSGAVRSVQDESGIELQLTTIDNIVKDEKVTFIKMDVEGAELKSLMGAKNTIIKNHPRLAICAYHKLEDLYELPKYILSLVPEYKFYLRHYSSIAWETVLYAYCD